MRYIKSTLLLCLLMAASSRGEEELADAVRIEAGGKPIDIGGYRGTAPFLGDFDGDGLADLFVAHEEHGRWRIYRNVGTKHEPRFDDFEWFRIDGQIAEFPGEGIFHPQLVDLDGDGKLDIVTPSTFGMVLWYRRTAAGHFADAEIVRLADGKVLIAGSDAGCHVVDWDGDGDSDLIVSGRLAPDAAVADVWFVENRGSPASLSLAAPRPLEADGKPIQSPQPRAYPFVADWNRDGKRDLMLGAPDGSVTLYENHGDARAPKLAPPRPLIGPAHQLRQPPDPDVPLRSSGGRFCVADWDNDGTLDLLIGDTQWVTVQPDSSDTPDQLEKKRKEAAELLSDYRRLRGLDKRLQDTQEKQKGFLRQKREQCAKRLDELHDAISILEKAMQPRQESHGYVWLLRRMNQP